MMLRSLFLCLVFASCSFAQVTVDDTASIAVVDTYADLANLTPQANRLVYTRGYTTAGDDGGALYKYDASTSSYVAVQTGVGVVNAIQQGAVADGTTDDTVDLQAAITAATGGVCYLPAGVYGVTSALTIPTGTTVWFAEGASLKKLSGTGNIFTITAANTRLVNATINLNSVGSRGIVLGSGSTGSRLDGTTTVTSAGTGGAATDGAVLLGSTSNIDIQDIIVNDCDGTVATYRGLDITSSTDVRVGSVSVTTGDIGVNVFAATNVSIGQIVANTLVANCLYIKDATSHVVVGSIEAETVANGITLDSSEAIAEVVIGSALISNATYGVDYRQGGGYLISNLYLVEAPIATTTAGTRSGLTIGTCRINYSGTGYRPINLATANYVTLQSVDVSCDAPLSNIAVQFTDCNYLTIGTMVINGIGASPTTEGVRFTASAVTNPVITVGSLAAHRVTTPYTVNSAITDPSSVVIDGAVQRYGGQTWQNLTSVQHTLKNVDTAVLSGDDLGELIVYGSDATSPGNKFRILVEATDNTGASRTYIYDDSGTLVGVIPASTTNQGMSILLPTTTTGLSSGMIYNNSGTVTVVP